MRKTKVITTLALTVVMVMAMTGPVLAAVYVTGVVEDSNHNRIGDARVNIYK